MRAEKNRGPYRGLVRAAVSGALMGMAVLVLGVRAESAPAKHSNGTPCNTNDECTSDRCHLGACVPADGQGQLRGFCNHDAQCISQHCEQDVRASTGRTNLCLWKIGAACNESLECSSLRCDRVAGNPRRCIPNDRTGKPGDYCSHNNQCASSNCMQSKCVAPATNGSPCTTNASCQSGRCDTVVGNQQVCIPNDGTGVVGDYCSHVNQCQNKNCVGQRCTALGAPGATCTSNIGCQSNRCDMAGGNPRKCIPNDGTGLVGNYCSHNNQCANKNCVDWVCKAPVGLGKDCVTDASCASNRCDTAIGNPRKCIPKDGTGPLGAHCTHNNQCLPGRACQLESGKKYGTCR